MDIHTPVGPLLVDLKVPLIDGEPDLQWLVCNPIALIYLLCQKSLKFSLLLLHSLLLVGDLYCGGLALYTDEATHGNQMRFDMSNELQCIYWCVPQLPSWFRRRKRGWFLYGFLRTDIQHKVIGGLPGLMRITLRHFYNPAGFNFAVGMSIPMGPGGNSVSIKLPFKCFVQYENAF